MAYERRLLASKAPRVRYASPDLDIVSRHLHEREDVAMRSLRALRDQRNAESEKLSLLARLDEIRALQIWIFTNIGKQ